MTSEKTYETEVFGVSVSSRYGCKSELDEMATFIRGLMRDHTQGFRSIKSISCDSKIGQINIDLNEDVISNDPEEIHRWCFALANFYHEETGEMRVIVMNAGECSFEETPDFEPMDFEPQDFDSPEDDYSGPPPGTSIH